MRRSRGNVAACPATAASSGTSVGLRTSTTISTGHSQRAYLREETAPGRAGLEQLVCDYLSVTHRDNPADGCPNAALLDEIGRCTDATRQAYTDGVLLTADDIAARLTPHDPHSARVKALSLFALLVGTLQFSRALTDPHLADQILEQGIHNALTLLDTDEETG